MAVSAFENITQLMLAGVVGLVLGAFLTLMTVPLMTFAQSSDTHQPIVNLLIPSPTIIIPWERLLTGTSASLLVFSAIIMVSAHIHLRSHLAMTLRLNED